MALYRADRIAVERLAAAIERLVRALDLLSDVIGKRTEQMKAGSRAEMLVLQKVAKLVESESKKSPAPKKAR